MEPTIPDLEKLTENMLRFIEYVDKPETRRLRETDIGNFNYIVNEQFSDLPTSMIKLLSDYKNRNVNLEKIIKMISDMRSVQIKKKQFQEVENEFFEKRAEEYLYPAFGGKDNYYKIAEENKKKKEQEKSSK